ncbi:hypothetical protein BDZ89DRAFT_1143257 [Hymenopellis radicata]|nr:hypothetical protein BDZ89DRAFT_1143257 [Hymenopellis radicata]
MGSIIRWNSAEGRAAAKLVVENRISSWKDGLRAHQEDPILFILNGEDVVLSIATGAGKSALFMVPLLCHLEISKNPNRYPPLPVKTTPVGIIVTPTNGLASNIVKHLEEYEITALAYCKETVVAAKRARRNLIQEIIECKYQIICVDPNDSARASSHGRVGRAFRIAFKDLGALFRGRLPSNVAIFGISATLEPGRQTAAVCRTLGFREGAFHLFRSSNERPDLQFIIEQLSHGINSRQFPQIIPYLNSGRKIVIHCRSLQMAHRVYVYLLRMEPSGVNHARRVRQYTSLCGDDFNRETIDLLATDPQLQVVVATVAIANGVHAPQIEDSLSLSMQDTLSEVEQASGRAARQDGAVGRAIVLVQQSDFVRAQKTIAGELDGVSSDGTRQTTKSKKKKTNTPMDRAKAELLTEKVCLILAKNRTFNNPGLVDCLEANREIWCSLCCERYRRPRLVFHNVAIHPPFLSPPDKTISTAKPRSDLKKLKPRKERPGIEALLVAYGKELIESTMFDAGNEYRPESAYFPSALRSSILDNLLQLSLREDLDNILRKHSWPFLDTVHSDKLWKILIEQQLYIAIARQRKTKAGAKKKKKKDIFDSESEQYSSRSESDTGMEVDESDGEDLDRVSSDEERDITPPTLKRAAVTPLEDITDQPRPAKRMLQPPTKQPTRPRAKQLSAQEVMASYGPVRTSRRR